MSAPRLIRFVCKATDEGIFQRAHDLRDADELQEPDRSELSELLAWFNTNLTTPARFVRTKSKGHYRREPVALSWFKDDARTCVERAWKLVRLLERHEVVIESIRTTQPGYVTYEDDQQVTAIPFSDR